MANRILSILGILIATWFGIGYLPFAPGTWGSLVALAIAWIVTSLFGTSALLLLVGITFCIGIWASEKFSKCIGDDDPDPVVVDEVVGQWLAVVFFPTQVIYYLLGFFLFRMFDIWKPWPVNWVDQNIKGGIGIMLDDIFASIYSIGTLFFFYQLNIIN